MIQNFTIESSSDNMQTYGICVYGSMCEINNNIIKGCREGIYVESSGPTYIMYNNLLSNRIGVNVYRSRTGSIYKNIINGGNINGHCVYLDGSRNITIDDNEFDNLNVGIGLRDCININITDKNSFICDTCDIYSLDCECGCDGNNCPVSCEDDSTGCDGCKIGC